MPRPKVDDRPCITPGCKGRLGGGLPKGKRGGRGLCSYCCTQAGVLVRKGITTWEEMERLGLAEPRFMTLVLKALVEARKGQEPNKGEPPDG